MYTAILSYPIMSTTLLPHGVSASVGMNKSSSGGGVNSTVFVNHSSPSASMADLEALCKEAFALQGNNRSDAECGNSPTGATGSIASVKTGIPKGVVKIMADYINSKFD